MSQRFLATSVFRLELARPSRSIAASDIILGTRLELFLIPSVCVEGMAKATTCRQLEVLSFALTSIVGYIAENDL